MRTKLIIMWLMSAALSTLTVASAGDDKTDNTDTHYNKALAKKLGADDYGMKMYVMAFLKTGPNRNRTPEEAAELQQGHMANIRRMAENGDLVLAGPFGQNEAELRGIYIFNVSTVEEAKALTESDPAIQAGSLIMDLVPWYGSAAVMQINEVHQTLAKKGM